MLLTLLTQSQEMQVSTTGGHLQLEFECTHSGLVRSVLQAPVRRGQLSFVDLAGSERASRTGNMGARLKCVLMR